MPESSSSPYIPGSTRSFRTTKIKRPEPGTAPGSIVADPTAPQPILRVVAYDSHRCAEATTTDPDSIQEYLEAWPVTWVSVNGLGNAEIVRRVGEIFRCHRLALEDVISVHQRPKVDEYEEHLFIVVRVPDATDGCGTRQVTLFLGESFVLTFEEATQTRFDRVRKRLRDGRGHLRRAGPDYLAYAILDAAIDCYFPVVESYGEQLEKLEEEIMARRHDEELVTRIHDARRELLTLRRLVRPLRDAVKLLLDDELPFVQEETRIHLRDCLDHTSQLGDLVDSYLAVASSLLDLYLSLSNNRMNEVMKVLTIVTTIFIPLSFVAGIYGMNFRNMPELDWHYGYPLSLGLMLGVAAALVYYFRRKGWV